MYVYVYLSICLSFLDATGVDAGSGLGYSDDRDLLKIKNVDAVVITGGWLRRVVSTCAKMKNGRSDEREGKGRGSKATCVQVRPHFCFLPALMCT